jgi:hypothetical protein
METIKSPVRLRGLGIASVIFGVLGGALCWWTPLGFILSLTGLVMGFVGWTANRNRFGGSSLLIAGMLISLAALILDWSIAGLGLEVIKLHSLR